MTIDIKQIQYLESEMLKEILHILEVNNIKVYLAFGSALGAVRHNGPIPWDHDADLFVWIDDVERVVSVLRSQLSERFIVDYNDDSGTQFTMFPRVSLPHTTSKNIHIDLFLLFGLADNQRERNKQYKKLTALHRIFAHYKVRSHFVRNQPLYKMMAKMEELFFLPVTAKWLKKKYFQIAQKYNQKDSTYVGYVGMGKGDKYFKRELFDPAASFRYEDFIVNLPGKYDEYLKECYGDYMQYPSVEERERGVSFKATIGDEDFKSIFN